MNLKRRQFLKQASYLGLSAVVPLAGYAWLQGEPKRELLRFEAVLEALDIFKVVQLSSKGEWSVGKILGHVAQSIELSIEGYPSHRSELFKSTIGRVAFKAFGRSGNMRHNLEEAIPGASKISQEISNIESIARLEMAIARFRFHQGTFEPHFAYGALTKEEYEMAHVLHFNDHVKELNIVTHQNQTS